MAELIGGPGDLIHNNYEVLLRKWQQQATSWNFRERYEAIGLSGYHENFPTILYFGRRYVIDRSNGLITDAIQPERELTLSTWMNIYNLFYYSKERPKLSGRWVSFQDIPRTNVFTKAFFGQTVNPFAKIFSGRMPELIRAGEKLGFRRIAASDVGFEADVFECLPIRFLFWDGDEEFSANANVLFDANVTDFVHAETVVTLASDGLQMLEKSADS